MYPSEMPYFNTENPVVRDELWNGNYYLDEDEDKEISVDFEVDGSNLSDEDLDNLIEEVEELGHKGSWLFAQSDFAVNYVYKSGEEYATSFTVCGWANEPVYEELMERLDYYGVKISKIA